MHHRRILLRKKKRIWNIVLYSSMKGREESNRDGVFARYIYDYIYELHSLV